MTASIQALAGAAQQIPAYCTSGTGIHTPQQWQTCWKLGWQEPVNGAANLGTATGHNGAPVLFILIAAAIALWIASRLARSGGTATG